MASERVVIVGAGQAGGQIAATLRIAGYAGEIALVGEEIHAPYHRPPLSKAYLAGKVDIAQVLLRPADFYVKHAIDLKLGARVVAIDRAQNCVTLTTGEMLPYSWLALATGARVRSLPIPGAHDPHVFYLRTLADIDHIRSALAGAARIVIIGGGFVGLEAAAVLRTSGLAVTVVEIQDRLMPRVVSPTVSAFYLELHGKRGVEVVTNTGVNAIVGRAVQLTNGRTVPADAVIIGVGVVPNVELAQAAGLACDNGIVVDNCARTEDPRIVAAGDCTQHPNALLGRRLRLESVHNAVEQAATAAKTILRIPHPYSQVPWFWSDQYEFKLQMVGISTGYDSEVVRGAIANGKFSVFHYREGKLLAIDSVNRPVDYMQGRRLLGAGLSPTPAQVADAAFDLKTIVAPN
jgi:3-phenylpropionate/trans-cinnamate dioxygenase ferredoxin reductase subunit